MLLSNSLFIDSEYKADCEHKINYLKYLKNDDDATSEKQLDTDDNSLHRNKQIADNLYKKLIGNYAEEEIVENAEETTSEVTE